jgi:c-di-GMP-binding flagellar brake protein YcgR
VLQRRKWWGGRVLLQWPHKLQVIERRESSREPIPEDVVVTAMLSDADGRIRILARLRDISLTGASFLCETSEPVSALQTGEAMRIVVTYGAHQHRLTASYRYTNPLSANTVRLGVQFDAEKSLAAGPLGRFRTMLEELEGLRIRRTFRVQLTKGSFEAA